MQMLSQYYEILQKHEKRQEKRRKNEYQQINKINWSQYRLFELTFDEIKQMIRQGTLLIISIMKFNTTYKG